jgi:hypothetical protein
MKKAATIKITNLLSGPIEVTKLDGSPEEAKKANEIKKEVARVISQCVTGHKLYR